MSRFHGHARRLTSPLPISAQQQSEMRQNCLSFIGPSWDPSWKLQLANFGFRRVQRGFRVLLPHSGHKMCGMILKQLPVPTDVSSHAPIGDKVKLSCGWLQALILNPDTFQTPFENQSTLQVVRNCILGRFLWVESNICCNLYEN